MLIKQATEHDREKWNDYRDSQPGISPLNHYVWRDILEESYGVKTKFFMLEDEKGDVRGLLPTYLTKSIRGKNCLYSLKFGLMGDNDEIKNELLLYLKDYCKKNNIISSLATSGSDEIKTEFQQIEKMTVVLELLENEDETWKSLRDKTRNMIRKGGKNGLVAERGFHQLKDFYRAYCHNMISKCVPIHSYNFFKSLSKKLGLNSELIIAKKNNEVAGGIWVLFGKDAAVYPFQSSYADYRQYAPNQFLIWEAAKLCLEKGIRKLDMGESVDRGNVHRFKVNFGGTPQSIYYYSHLLKKENHGRLPTPTVSPTHTPLSGVMNRMLSQSPFWLRKQASIWLKTKGKII